MYWICIWMYLEPLAKEWLQRWGWCGCVNVDMEGMWKCKTVRKHGIDEVRSKLQQAAASYSNLQQAAASCNKLQQVAASCNKLQDIHRLHSLCFDWIASIWDGSFENSLEKILRAPALGPSRVPVGGLGSLQAHASAADPHAGVGNWFLNCLELFTITKNYNE